MNLSVYVQDFYQNQGSECYHDYVGETVSEHINTKHEYSCSLEYGLPEPHEESFDVHLSSFLNCFVE